MKWIFLLGLLMAVPLMVGLLRANPRHLLVAGFAIGLLPFAILPLHLFAAPVSWAGWPGEVKGIEITIIDAIALAIVITTPRVRLPGPIVLAFGFYFFAVLLSSVVSIQRIAATFYIWQLLRSVLLCVAVARATAAVRTVPIAILTGAGIGLSFAALNAGNAMLHGAEQAGGLLGHQNSLGLASHFIVYPAVAMALAGRRPLLSMMIVGAELVVVLAGGSRATIGLFAVGVGVTIALSCWKQMTGRKTAIVAAALVLLAVSAPAMLWAVNRRSEEARLSSNTQRSAMIRASRMMIADHPFGVGPNQYVLVANMGGYSDRAGVGWDLGNRTAPVHNSYYLAAVEFGVLGFVAFAGMLLTIIGTGLRAIRRAPGGERTDVLVGVVASLIVGSIHFGFEWISMTFYIHYLFAMSLGLMIGIRASIGARSRAGAMPARVPGVRALQPV